MFRDKQSTKRESIKKGITSEDARRKREENFTEIRKNKREEMFSAKRRPVGYENDNKGELDMAVSAETSNSNNSPIVYDDNILREIATLPRYCEAIRSEDPNAQLQATTQIRKMLSVGMYYFIPSSDLHSYLEKNPPIDHVIQSGVVPRLIQLLGSNFPKLVFEAAWVLTNIASGNLHSYFVEITI